MNFSYKLNFCCLSLHFVNKNTMKRALIMIFGPVILCHVFAVIFAIFTKVCRFIKPFFAVIFYCPYLIRKVERLGSRLELEISYF